MPRDIVHKFRRHLLGALTWASFVLCVAVTALWVWSHLDSWSLSAYTQRPADGGRDDVRMYALTNLPGTLSLTYQRLVQIRQVVGPYGSGPLRRVQFRYYMPHQRLPPTPRNSMLSRCGFWLERLTIPGGNPTYWGFRAGMPHWLPVVVFALAPAVRWTRERRRLVRVREGRCTSCGYDLRASPERCPECGASPVPAEARADSSK